MVVLVRSIRETESDHTDFYLYQFQYLMGVSSEKFVFELKGPDVVCMPFIGPKAVVSICSFFFSFSSSLLFYLFSSLCHFSVVLVN